MKSLLFVKFCLSYFLVFVLLFFLVAGVFLVDVAFLTSGFCLFIWSGPLKTGAGIFLFRVAGAVLDTLSTATGSNWVANRGDLRVPTTATLCFLLPCGGICAAVDDCNCDFTACLSVLARGNCHWTCFLPGLLNRFTVVLFVVEGLLGWGSCSDGTCTPKRWLADHNDVGTEFQADEPLESLGPGSGSELPSGCSSSSMILSTSSRSPCVYAENLKIYMWIMHIQILCWK